ncbi:hypothetical protein Q6A87_08535 [Aliarcobacter skirrowii]|uniref:hypothetical protein n=1 Tax=Aliarcobacter skirrowii TaxID=28200 RepID=UPI0029A43B5B|nr:hypothetical protein [Aliarcobacter skirrowii]MDX4067894.1 hypothetical protein [Aliarcobacter skirrowii]
MNFELKKINELINKYKPINNMILLFSVISINFSAYISFFDINAFHYVNLSTLLNYIFSLFLPFSLISGAVLLSFLFLKDYLMLPFYSYKILKTSLNIVKKLLSNKIIKIIIIILLFSFISIGMMQTFILISLSIFFFGAIFLYKGITHEITINKNKFIRMNNLNKKIFKLLRFSILKKEFLFATKLLQSRYFGNMDNLATFISSHIGLIIIFLSIFFGTARAQYISDNNIIKIKNKEYILILNNSNNLLLYDTSKEVVIVKYDTKLNEIILKKDKKINTNIND